MKMFTRNFNSMREATDWINAAGLTKDQIVNIFPSPEGTYLLVYYGEE